MSSLKTNIILNYINTITSVIFPVITFPYASRILMPEGIGVVNFQMSIINYIVLFTSLGIPLYAVREVAKYRDDIFLRNKVTIEITTLSIILCSVGYVVVYFISQFIPQVNDNIALFYILSLTILFQAISLQWFYQAIEEFRYITIRALIIRTLSAISLFIFVKDQSDVLLYGLVTVGSTVGNSIINFVHLRKYIPISSIKYYKLDIFKHLKPALHIFVLNIIISIYVQLNTIMLGFMQGDYAVGIYTAGNRLPHMVLSVVTSIGAVLLPRCSNLVANKQTDAFISVTKKSLKLVLLLSLPATVGLLLLSESIIYIFCGPDFLEAAKVIYWTAPIIFFIGVTNVIGIQVLYPLGKENIVIISTLSGAVVNLILNLILIPKYSAVGAGISTFTAELVVLIVQLYLGHKYISITIFDKEYSNYLIGAVIMAIVISLPITLIDNYWIKTIVSCCLGFVTYVTYLYGAKDPIVELVKKQIFKV